MRKCRDMENRFTAYLDGYLDTAERAIVEEHLSTCPDCLHKIEELKRMRVILAGLDEIDPPPGLTEKIMSRINEEEEGKPGFFRRLFFPLHIKVPVQALATVFVVVLAVYVFRSTLHETTNLERPSTPPPAAETMPHAVKKEAPARTSPESASPKPVVPTPAQALKKEAAGPTTAPAPGVVAEASPPVQAYKALPQGAGVSEKVSIPEGHTDDTVSFSMAAPPAEEGRAKMRGRMMEEKSKAPESVPAPSLRAGSSSVRSHVAMMSKDPRRTAILAKTIMRDLGATRIEESTTDSVATVSGWIDTTVIKELMARLKEIAQVDEPNSSLASCPRSSFIEITIREHANSDGAKPADR